MRLALTLAAFTLGVVPAFAQSTFEIQRPNGTWQQPREFQQPMGPWRQPGEFQQPGGNWQVPGPIQTPRWLVAHTTHALPRSYDRRQTAFGDARFDVDKADLRLTRTKFSAAGRIAKRSIEATGSGADDATARGLPLRNEAPRRCARNVNSEHPL